MGPNVFRFFGAGCGDRCEKGRQRGKEGGGVVARGGVIRGKSGHTRPRRRREREREGGGDEGGRPRTAATGTKSERGAGTESAMTSRYTGLGKGRPNMAATETKKKGRACQKSGGL